MREIRNPNQIAIAKAQTDAFGLIETSSPYSIFDSKLLNDKQPLFYDEVLNGTATSVHDPDTSGGANVEMTVSSNGDYAIRQTFMRFNYQPGKSQKILLTGVLGEPVANTSSKIGYFNTSTVSPYTADEDGLYYGCDGTGVYIAVSKFGSTTTYNQSAWNIDKLDGTGPSGVTIDWDSTQIFGVEFEWLGVGSIWFFLVVDGFKVYVHKVNNANAGQSEAYMLSPNHSIRYEVRSTGGTKVIQQVCGSVQSMGGVEPSGVTRTINNDITPISCTTTLEGILFFRLNSSRPCTTLEIDTFSVLNTANNTNNYRWAILRNPTIAGTALSYTNLTNSAIDYAPGQGDNTLTGGTELVSGYASGSVPGLSFSTNTLINPGIAVDGTQDEFCLAIKTFSGTDTFVSAINIRELTCG